MDLTTLAGLLLASGMVLIPFLGGLETQNLSLSLVFVAGGTLGATILSVPHSHLRSALSSLVVAFGTRRRGPRDTVERLVELSDLARRDGVLALESRLASLDDGFLRRGLALAVDGTEPASIEETLRQEIDETRKRHEQGKMVLERIARYAPAYGMLGTLTALIHMLTRWGESSVDGLGHASEMLPKMGFALGTTFCGIFLANAVALPLSDKLAEKDREEALLAKIVLHGILAIESGDNPRSVKEHLNAFLPPEDRL